MALAPGARLGAYELLSPLGAGGMGEVWRARDTRLDRSVAIKVLTDDLAGDATCLARFEREAKAVAALSHPNILALHDIGDEGGVRFAVLELLDGETLRRALGHGTLPVRRVLEIAGQLADGLAAAHQKGIVHRDVKPENVFLTTDGRAKLLDFGLAKETSPLEDRGDTQSPTSSVFTGAGVVLGTVSYMSPEQAKGSTVDHRSDQFSLGVVLYEMLAGRRPFGRASVAEMLTAIIREEPEPLGALAPDAPAPLRWLVERLLAKEPKGRYDSTGDLARELKTLSLHLSDARTSTESPRAATRGRRSWKRVVFVVALAVCAALAGVGVTWALLRSSPGPPAAAVRFEVRLPEGHSLSGFQRPFALSPDGRLLVYSAFAWKKPFEEGSEPKLFLRSLDSVEAQPVAGTEGGIQPVFSPDGHQIAFIVLSEGGVTLKKVPVTGGPALTICKCDARAGIAWPADGAIVFASVTGPLMRVTDTGGSPEPVTSLDASQGEVSHRLPNFLPDGRTVLYTALRWTTAGNPWKASRIYVQVLGQKERALLAEGGSDGRWVPPGYLLFAREGRLLAAPFGASARRLAAPPVPVLEGLSHSIWTASSRTEVGAAMLDAAGARHLAWIPGSVAPEHRSSLVLVDASGKETPIDLPKGPYLGGRVSSDGERLLLWNGYPGRQVELLDFIRGSRRNVTFEMNPLWAIWGPGPDRITFVSYHDGPGKIYSRRIDAGPDEVDALWDGTGHGHVALGSWSRDGRFLAFCAWDEKTDFDIWLLEAGKGARPYLATRSSEGHPDVSPDGRWLLYDLVEPGRQEVFVRPFPVDGPPRQVSVEGGREALWSRDGTAIFYRGRTQRTESLPNGTEALFRVAVTAKGEGLSFGRPEKLFAADYSGVFPGHGWDVTPDGRFVFVKFPDNVDSRAQLEKLFPDSIRVELDGLPALLAGATKSR